eukprot:5560137-Pyramimonas_sp.AAC.1
MSAATHPFCNPSAHGHARRPHRAGATNPRRRPLVTLRLVAPHAFRVQRNLPNEVVREVVFVDNGPLSFPSSIARLDKA